MLRLVSRLITCLALVLIVPASSYAASYTLRATANSNKNDEDYDGLVAFKNYVENASNGQIKVEIYMGTQLCSNGAECLQGVAGGQVDIYMSNSGGAAGIFPYVQVFDLPYLMNGDRVAEKVLSGKFTRQLRQFVLRDSDNTIRLMTIGNTGGWRSFANTKKRVRTPADLKGMKIRSIVADLPQELITAMGASPTPIPWSELYTSLQTGVVDGTKNGITDIMAMKFPEAGVKYLTLDRHAYMAALWWMNNQKFESLPDNLKKVVIDGFYDLQQATFASPKRKSIEAYKEFKAEGGDVYVPTEKEKAAFKKAAQPVYSWFEENIPDGKKILTMFKADVASAQKEVDAERAAEMK